MDGRQGASFMTQFHSILLIFAHCSSACYLSGCNNLSLVQCNWKELQPSSCTQLVFF